MTTPTPSETQSTYPPNNALRIGTMNGGNTAVEVQGAAVDAGYVLADGGTPGAPTALLRGESSWLALGTVSSIPQALMINLTTSGTNSAAIGAEADAMTSVAMRFRNNRIFRATHGAFFTSSVANTALVRLNQTAFGVGGTLGVQRTVGIPTASGPWLTHQFMFCNISGGDITDMLSISLTASAGTVTESAVNPTGLRYITVEDMGPITDFNGVTPPSLG